MLPHNEEAGASGCFDYSRAIHASSAIAAASSHSLTPRFDRSEKRRKVNLSAACELNDDACGHFFVSPQHKEGEAG